MGVSGEGRVQFTEGSKGFLVQGGVSLLMEAGKPQVVQGGYALGLALLTSFSVKSITFMDAYFLA